MSDPKIKDGIIKTLGKGKNISTSELAGILGVDKKLIEACITDIERRWPDGFSTDRSGVSLSFKYEAGMKIFVENGGFEALYLKESLENERTEKDKEQEREVRRVTIESAKLNRWISVAAIIISLISIAWQIYDRIILSKGK